MMLNKIRLPGGYKKHSRHHSRPYNDLVMYYKVYYVSQSLSIVSSVSMGHLRSYCLSKGQRT